MPTDNDFDLQPLVAAWHGDDGPSLAEVKRDLRRRIRRSRVLLVTELSVATAGLLAGIVLCLGRDWLPGIATLVFSACGALASLYARGATWRRDEAPVSSRTALLERQLVLVERGARAGLLVCGLAIAFLAVLVLPADARELRLQPLAMVCALALIAGGAMVSLYGIADARRRQRQLRAVRDLRQPCRQA